MKLLNTFIRSPHVYEVLLAYGTVHIISLYLMIFHYNTDCKTLILSYVCGGFLYTFIEYFFHRVILHHWIFK